MCSLVQAYSTFTPLLNHPLAKSISNSTYPPKTFFPSQVHHSDLPTLPFQFRPFGTCGKVIHIPYFSMLFSVGIVMFQLFPSLIKSLL
jgi:hypothetical protein